MTATNALGYVRLSRLTEESTSVERQREVIEAACLARDWHLVGVEEDVDVSASSRSLAERPGLQRARQRIAAGEASVLVCWKLDRLARNVGDFSTIIGTRPSDWRLQVASATEPLDTTSPMGRAMAQVLQVFAELEAKTIGIRVASSIDYLVRNGRNRGGVVPFGQRSIPNPAGAGFVTVVDPAEAALVREALDRVLAGETVAAIARDWTARKISNALGKSNNWHPASLARLLRNPALAGMTRHRGDLLRDEDGLPSIDHSTAIITTDERRALLDALGENGAGWRPRTGADPALLAGLARCGSCDSLLYRSTASGRSDPYYYRCRRLKGDGPGECATPVGIGLTNLDAHVESAFLGAVGRFPVVEHIEGPRVSSRDLRDIEDALTETASALAATDDDAVAEDLQRRLRTLRTRRRDLQAAEAAAPTIRVVEHGGTFADAWDAEDTAGRRALLGEAIDAVIVNPGDRTRGRRGFDPARVDLLWREGSQDPD